jgi:hypothetical protein
MLMKCWCYSYPPSWEIVTSLWTYLYLAVYRCWCFQELDKGSSSKLILSHSYTIFQVSVLIYKIMLFLTFDIVTSQRPLRFSGAPPSGWKWLEYPILSGGCYLVPGLWLRMWVNACCFYLDLLNQIRSEKRLHLYDRQIQSYSHLEETSRQSKTIRLVQVVLISNYSSHPLPMLEKISRFLLVVYGHRILFCSGRCSFWLPHFFEQELTI